MAFALSFEPVEYIAVNTKMHGCFAPLHHDPGAFPKVFAHASVDAIWSFWF